MGWSLGEHNGRDIGYGVPAICDHPKCNVEINRGLAYVCCDQKPYGGEKGCGRFFCYGHANWNHRCSRCTHGREPWPMKTDVREWIEHKLNDESWQQWRDENPVDVALLKAELPASIAKALRERQ